MTIGLKRNWSMHHVDIKTAYLHGWMACDIFMKTPKGVEKKKNNILLVVGRLYSMNQGRQQWNIMMNSELTRMGFEEVGSEHSTYVLCDAKRK
jgi:hypothetical protein